MLLCKLNVESFVDWIWFNLQVNQIKEVKMGWQMWLGLIGGILAVVGQWWGASFYLGAIGGVLAIIGALGMMSK